MAHQPIPTAALHRRSGSRLFIRQGPPTPRPPFTTSSSITTSSDSQGSLSSAIFSESSTATAAASSISISSLSLSEESTSAGITPSSISSLSSATPTTAENATSSSSTTSSLESTSSTSRSIRSTRTSIPLISSSTVETSSQTSQITPATTLILTGDVSDATVTSVSRTITFDASAMETSSSSPVSAAASSNGFWSNRGAVGGTFAIVGIVILGIFVVVIVIIKRRTTQRQERIERSLFDNYSEPASSHGHSPGPSINISPLDAFETRQFYSNISADPFGGNDSFISGVTSNRVIPQPSPAKNAQPSTRQTGAAPSLSSRTPAGRDSGYQRSIDSFYGVAGQPPAQAY